MCRHHNGCLIVLLMLDRSTEQELRQQFLRFGPVQSVILNREKRHAFVKMCNRHDAVEARSGMENGRNEGSKARTVSDAMTWNLLDDSSSG